jgi:methyltransferase-like protein
MNISEIFNSKALFATRKVGTELILVPVKKSVADMNEIFTLNEVGNFIWEQIDGKNTEEDIFNAITEEFDIDSDTAKKDVIEFLDRLTDLIQKT